MKENKKIGLFFGSFNPIHNGHLIVAEYLRELIGFKKIIFVVSPQNPFKTEDDLWPEDLRFSLLQEAIKDNPYFEASKIEFSLPKPSYTYRTLCEFREVNPDCDFSVIMGSDNLIRLSEWKNIDKILTEFKIEVYSRSDFNSDLNYPNVRVHNTPLVDISATMIRDRIFKGLTVKYLLPDSVIEILKKGKQISSFI